jgi:LysM repeat protein
MKKIILSSSLLLLNSCSPLKSSPHDEKYQLELTLHEVQTNLDELKHEIHCFKTEFQIIDGRIKSYENAIANMKHQGIDQLTQQMQVLEKKWAALEKTASQDSKELTQLLTHANETTAALSQFKDRIQELEETILHQNRKFDDLSKLKGNIESLTLGYKAYRVKSGDSLEKIARSHKIPVDKIKKANHLDQDLIVVGQELKIPNE